MVLSALKFSDRIAYRKLLLKSILLGFHFLCVAIHSHLVVSRQNLMSAIPSKIIFFFLMIPNHNNKMVHNKLQQKYIFKIKFTNTYNFTIHLNSSQ